VKTVDEILALPDEAMCLCLGDCLEASVDHFGVVGLSPLEQALWFALEFDRTFRGDGVLACFVRDSGANARLAVAALEKVGAGRVAELLSEASVAYASQAYDEFNVIAARVAAEYPDMSRVLCRYAREHRLELIPTLAH
jgi:hypothetical protein